MTDIDTAKLRVRIAGRLAKFMPSELVALDVITAQIEESRRPDAGGGDEPVAMVAVPFLTVLDGGLL
jgi:hypothetical protein